MRSESGKSGAVSGWLASGDVWLWTSAAAVGLSVTAVIGLLTLIAVRGFGHFWPAELIALDHAPPEQEAAALLGELVERETLSAASFKEVTGRPTESTQIERYLLKTGNRRSSPPDFRWVYAQDVQAFSAPVDAVQLERVAWGDAFGWLNSMTVAGTRVSDPEALWADFQAALRRVETLRDEIRRIERQQMNPLNHRLNQLRLTLRERRLAEGSEGEDPGLAATEAELLVELGRLEAQLATLRRDLDRDSVEFRRADGGLEVLSLGSIVRAWQPNRMSWFQKLQHFASSLWLFLSEAPREANTEGGIYPAIFGTVLMVLLMSVLVTPMGVIAAIYLMEYASQGPLVRLIRIAVNNLAGVPSIVYGVFGLGFFVYFIGGNLDRLFFEAALPAPTFGTPGLIWASLTLALLTVPVVIVATEEGLARIPRAIRDGSLALGATRAETLFRVVLPLASPAILTGTILAVARAAGEVAPLMLVGVVKSAPTLPIDGNFPFLHLERKFMHLGFHIYDVGFQSPNAEAAQPLVYATALLLVSIIVLLNLTAILLRNRLEARYRGSS